MIDKNLFFVAMFNILLGITEWVIRGPLFARVWFMAWAVLYLVLARWVVVRSYRRQHRYNRIRILTDSDLLNR